MTFNLLEQLKTEGILEQLPDQSKVVDFVREIPIAGDTAARLVSYIELGEREQPDYMGTSKKPSPEVMVTFQLLSKKHQKEVEVEGVKTIYYPCVSTRIAIKRSEKSGFSKLFKKMCYGRECRHMAFLIQEAFILTISHKQTQDGQRTYATFKNEDGWQIKAPLVKSGSLDEEAASTPLAVIEQTVPIKLFIWDRPTIEQWDSLFIDGTYTKKNAEGVEKVHSKNWLQEEMQSKALNYAGSALQTLLFAREGLDLDGGKSEGAVEESKSTVVQTTAPTPVAAHDDALAQAMADL